MNNYEISEKVKQAAEEMRVVFLSGAVTHDKNYREKFGLAEQVLSKMGYVVLSPAVLPDGLEYDEYLRITLAMLGEADGVCVFNDWAESNGARVEIEEALHKGMPIVRWADFQKIYLSAKAELDALNKQFGNYLSDVWQADRQRARTQVRTGVSDGKF